MNLLKLSIILLFILSSSFAGIKPVNDNFRGEGVYTWFFLDVYKAKLWANEGKDILKGPVSLELRYLRILKGKDIAKQSIKELTSLGVDQKLTDNWYPHLLKIFPDVKDGDKILANYSPTTGIVFYLNGSKKLGLIRDSNFSLMFMKIWLDEKTSAQDLRNKLLGISNE